MGIVRLFLLTALLAAADSSLSKETNNMRYVTGREYRAIESASAIAKAKGLDIDKYRISVQDKQLNKNGVQTNEIVVFYTDLKALWPSQTLGNPRNIPGLEVRLDPTTLNVRSSAFIR